MLVKATAEDIRKYGELVYSLALDPAKSCYPTYGDGIKTKAGFFDAARRAIERETSEVLLFDTEERIEGWVSYFWVPEDRYLQLDGFNINRGTEQALAELLDRIKTEFAGYTAYFGFPADNREAVAFLRTHGFKCIEQDWNHSFFFDSYTPKEYDQRVEKISCENFEKFRAVYHADPETYWDCDRIFERIDDWIIFVYGQSGTPIATVFLTGGEEYFEIYGTEFADGVFQEAVFRELLTASLNECKRLGAKFLTYFCGEEERHVLTELGFRCVGRYVLYVTEITAVPPDTAQCGFR